MARNSNRYDTHSGDAETWQELKQGNKNALELIFHRYHADLFRYAVKLTGNPVQAEDHIQELFLRIWNRRDNLGDVTGVKTYLWTALRRSLLAEQKEKSWYEQRNGVEQRSDKLRIMQFSAEELIIHQEENTQRSRALKQAMDQLSDKQREILYLKYFDGMSYEEIEEIMSINYQTARNYVYEGLKALKVVINTRAAGIILPALGVLLSFCLLHFLFLLL